MDKFYDDKIEDFEKRIDQTTDRICVMLGDKEARARLNLDPETDLEKSFKKCIENLDKFDVDISKSLGMVNLSLRIMFLVTVGAIIIINGVFYWALFFRG